MSEGSNAAIELHDSELGAINDDSHGSVTIRLTPAYVHRSAGEPGWDDGIGGRQRCALVFDQGGVEGLVGELPTDIMSGDFHVGAQTYLNMIRLPCQNVGETVELTLFLSPDCRRLTISGTGVSVRLEGEWEYVERFQGNR